MGLYSRWVCAIADGGRQASVQLQIRVFLFWVGVVVGFFGVEGKLELVVRFGSRLHTHAKLPSHSVPAARHQPQRRNFIHVDKTRRENSFCWP